MKKALLLAPMGSVHRRFNCANIEALMELGFDLGQYFSVHTYSQQEWQKMSFLPFYKNVERDKIQLV